MLELIEDQIKCVICFEDYDSPISLYCGHTFCRQCLKRSQNMVCPICRSIIFSSVDNMRENDTICKLIRQVRNRHNNYNNILLFEPQDERPLFQQFFDVEKIKIKQLPMFNSGSKQILLPFMTYKITIKSDLWQPPKQLKNVVIKQGIDYINRSYRRYYTYGHLSNIQRKPNSLFQFNCLFQVMHFFQIENEETIVTQGKKMAVCSGSCMNQKTGLGIEHFQPFFKIYDNTSDHYKNSILSVVSPDAFSYRQNVIRILYSIFAILNIGNAEKYSVLTTFDDQIRLQRLRSYFTNISTDHAIRNPTAVFNIPVPGYSKTRTVYISIIILFILWKFGWIPSFYGSTTVS